MDNPEIVLNLWYITDGYGNILWLKGKPYVATGNDDQKLKFLESRALLDYLIATDYPVPDNLRISIDGEKFSVTTKEIVRFAGGEAILFSDVFKEIERNLPDSCFLKLPMSPMIIITPLKFIEKGKIEPFDNMEVESF